MAIKGSAKIFICKICEKEYDYKVSRGTQTCSLDCLKKLLSNMRMGEGNPRFNNGWRQYRKYKSELTLCERCGCEEKLEVHHLDANRKNNDFSNLIRVCRFCHMELDGRFANLDFKDSGTGLCSPGREAECQK